MLNGDNMSWHSHIDKLSELSQKIALDIGAIKERRFNHKIFLQVLLQSMHVIRFDDHADRVAGKHKKLSSTFRRYCFPNWLSWHLCPSGVSPVRGKVGRQALFWICPWKQAQPALCFDQERCWQGAKQGNLMLSSCLEWPPAFAWHRLAHPAQKYSIY